MGIPLPPSHHSDSQTHPHMAATRETEVDFEQDAHLKKMLERKHKLEEAEIYNSPETMAKKRKAVKEQAQTVPKRSPSTDLQFDDNIESTPAASQHEAPEPEKKSKPKTPRKEALRRNARRTRVAARRRDAKTQAAADAELGQEQSPETLARTTRRGKRRLGSQKEQLSKQLEA